MSEPTGPIRLIDHHAQSEELKNIFRNGWSNLDRVNGWFGRVVLSEFGQTASRNVWKNALKQAVEGLNAADSTTEALDMGTGPGTIATLWAELGFKTTGLDFSPGMLSAARDDAENRGLKIDYVEADAENPHFEPDRFSIISSRLVLFTLPHPGLAVRRWFELLKPGGLMVLIGEEHDANRAREPRPESRPESTQHSGWRADENYRKALDQLPFMHHDARTLSVVMEAAGLSEVRLVPMHDVIAERKKLAAQNPPVRVFPSSPYILVGQK